MTGILLLVLAIGIWLIRNRALLPPTAGSGDASAAFRRRFEGREPDGVRVDINRQ